MNILDFYKSILISGGLQVKNNKVYTNPVIFGGLEDDSKEIKIDGKNLLLPADDILRNNNKSDIVLFHPLYELATKPESPELNKLRQCLVIRLNYIIPVLIQNLALIASSIEKQKLLDPDQQVILSILPEANEKLVNSFNKICTNAIKNEKSHIKIFLKKGGIVNGERYSKAAIVNFEVVDELLKDNSDFLSATFNKKHKESFIKLMNFILPEVSEVGKYNKGTNDDVAPFLHSLMLSFLNIANKLNDVIDLFSNLSDDIAKLKIPLDWEEIALDLKVMRRELAKIPNQNQYQEREIERPNLNFNNGFNNNTFNSGFNNTFNRQQITQPQPTVQRTSKGLDFRSITANMGINNNFNNNQPNNNGSNLRSNWGNNNSFNNGFNNGFNNKNGGLV